MSKLGTKCQHFVWPPLFFQHCLNPLGHGVHQSFTGCHWSPHPLWWMLETLSSSTFHLRMPHICSIGFRSGDMLGQSITFTLSFFSKAVVIIMLEYCPAAQSPKRGDHALLQYVTVHVGIHGCLNKL